MNSCLTKRKYYLSWYIRAVDLALFIQNTRKNVTTCRTPLYSNISEYRVQSIWLDATENIPLGDSAKMEVAGRLLSELLHPSTSISAYYPHPRPHFPSESQTHWCIEAFTSHYFLGLEYGEANWKDQHVVRKKKINIELKIFKICLKDRSGEKKVATMINSKKGVIIWYFWFDLTKTKRHSELLISAVHGPLLAE